jgi:hypothetical protein
MPQVVAAIALAAGNWAAGEVLAIGGLELAGEAALVGQVVEAVVEVGIYAGISAGVSVHTLPKMPDA